MILIQTSKIKFWTIILVSFFIVFSFRILISVLNKEYIQNIYYKISESYILDRYDERFEQVDLDILDINFTKNLGFTRCPNIIKIQQIKNYIVGYSLGEENITSFEEQKFGNIEYLKTNDFLNKYGYGSNNQENITNIIIYNFLLSIFWILLVFIFHYKFKNSKMGNHIRRFFENILKKENLQSKLTSDTFIYGINYFKFKVFIESQKKNQKTEFIIDQVGIRYIKSGLELNWIPM